MSKCIRFDRTKFDSKGRNGYIGTTGINVVSLGEELFLEPITSRGVNSEACRIVLPKSEISTLIEALKEFAPAPRDGRPRTRPGEASPGPPASTGSRCRSGGGMRARSQSSTGATQCLATS